MTAKKTIKNAIKRKFPTIRYDDSLEEAIKLMTTRNVSVLVVKVGADLIGLVTNTDVMHSLARGDDLKETQVASFMTPCDFDVSQTTRNPCLQLDENEDLLSAVKVMYHAGVNHLMVSGSVTGPVGIVSSLEIIKLIGEDLLAAGQFPAEVISRAGPQVVKAEKGQQKVL